MRKALENGYGWVVLMHLCWLPIGGYRDGWVVLALDWWFSCVCMLLPPTASYSYCASYSLFLLLVILALLLSFVSFFFHYVHLSL